MQPRVGAKGALLDEYQRALAELEQVIGDVTPKELIFLADSVTMDPDCRSIQTILTHVVRSGFSYANYIRSTLNTSQHSKDLVLRNSVEEYIEDLRDMFSYNVDTFSFFEDRDLEVSNPRNAIAARWGKTYDIEQILEHAIVHILRHRRQIEKFKKNLRV